MFQVQEPTLASQPWNAEVPLHGRQIASKEIINTKEAMAKAKARAVLTLYKISGVLVPDPMSYPRRLLGLVLPLPLVIDQEQREENQLHIWEKVLNRPRPLYHRVQPSMTRDPPQPQVQPTRCGPECVTPMTLQFQDQEAIHLP